MAAVRHSLPTLIALALLAPTACNKEQTPSATPTSDSGATPVASAADDGAADDGADDAAAADDGGEPEAPKTPIAVLPPNEGETHFVELTQLTNGGENAEAYLSTDESQLVFQSKREGMQCDQIFTMTLEGADVTRISNGKGRTTCSYFLPGDEKILYASTHGAADDCLPEPDRSHGYVWKLYDEFDIYISNADGSEIQPLITGPGYDAEATISPAGDKIVFTSTRDGDPEIYTADIDGTNIKRLTKAKGYDGGPFFSPDGKKIVYRANHPKGKDEKAKYDEIIKEGLVRPTRLELFVMDANGKNKKQITDNGKANFGPYFHPDGKRIIFATNLGDEQGRDFDLYMIGVDGKNLEQITKNPTFDGFPMFTRDGKHLVFASNRNNAAEGDTNVFIAEWKD